ATADSETAETSDEEVEQTADTEETAETVAADEEQVTETVSEDVEQNEAVAENAATVETLEETATADSETAETSDEEVEQTADTEETAETVAADEEQAEEAVSEDVEQNEAVAENTAAVETLEETAEDNSVTAETSDEEAEQTADTAETAVADEEQAEETVSEDAEQNESVAENAAAVETLEETATADSETAETSDEEVEQTADTEETAETVVADEEQVTETVREDSEQNESVAENAATVETLEETATADSEMAETSDEEAERTADTAETAVADEEQVVEAASEDVEQNETVADDAAVETLEETAADDSEMAETSEEEAEQTADTAETAAAEEEQSKETVTEEVEQSETVEDTAEREADKNIGAAASVDTETVTEVTSDTDTDTDTESAQESAETATAEESDATAEEVEQSETAEDTADWENDKNIAAAALVDSDVETDTSSEATAETTENQEADNTAEQALTEETAVEETTSDETSTEQEISETVDTDSSASESAESDSSGENAASESDSEAAEAETEAEATQLAEESVEGGSTVSDGQTVAEQTSGSDTETESTDSAASEQTYRLGTYGYRIYSSDEYGDYISVEDFGADPTGQTDSWAAIQAALEAAHLEGVMLYLGSGTYYISQQIVIDDSVSGVQGIFGAGMGETIIQFDWDQDGVFNSNTNEDDIREYAGILIDGQSNKTIASLSVEYTNDDFYREGESYFGKVCGILVNDADNTLISKVEVSGVNRAGVFFTSTDALTKEEGSSSTYKARVRSGEIDETYEYLPLGENNRLEDCYLHNNRVAGAMVAYQQNFVAEGNYLAWNGHEADGGTGYGITTMAGSYNYGITYRENTTDHNYRKGLDVHDGTDILIENNTLNGDRLYGIAVYNRQFSMDNVIITGNTITQDETFRLETDDNDGYVYHMYSAIQVQTNTQFQDLHTADTGYFEISNNTINNLTLYDNNIQTYAIEFRNHETSMDYTLNITGNVISGDSTKYLIAVINDTQDKTTGEDGIGSGTINISGNEMTIGTIASGAVAVYVEERNSDDIALHGSVTIDSNTLTITEAANGYAEFAYLIGNAEEYNVTNNTLNLYATLRDGLVVVSGTGDGTDEVDAYVANNTINTDLTKLYATWLRYTDAEVYADGNTHNGDDLTSVNTLGTDLTLEEVLSNVSDTVTAANNAVYAALASSNIVTVADNTTESISVLG
ncbi:hypothetical protein J2T38_000395, partial [Neisseria perflava]